MDYFFSGSHQNIVLACSVRERLQLLEPDTLGSTRLALFMVHNGRSVRLLIDELWDLYDTVYLYCYDHSQARSVCKSFRQVQKSPTHSGIVRLQRQFKHCIAPYTQTVSIPYWDS